MLNNKGFTIAEVLVSFSLITLILLSIISTTVFYRDKLKEEEVKYQLVDFKNSITKIIYDDVISGKVNRVETCYGKANCVDLIGDTERRRLKIVEVLDSSTSLKRGAYLSYGDPNGNEVKYMLPDSDIAEEINGIITRVCDFTNGIKFEFYNEELYTIKTSFEHKDYNLKYDIMITLNKQ